MGVPFFVPGWHGSFGPVGPCGEAYAIRPYMGTRPFMYPANLAGIPDAPLQTVGFSFPPSLTAGESADVTQAEDEAADRNGRSAKQ